MFEKASRLKLRFTTPKGPLAIEDLWDLNLESLNTVAKTLNKELKASTEENFIKVKTNASTTLQLKFDIVLHIIDVKMAEETKRKQQQLNKQRKEQILEILDKKRVDDLSSKSERELLAELASLE